MYIFKRLSTKPKHIQKFRKYTIFKFYKNNKNFFKIISLSNYKLYSKNISFLNLLMKRFLSKKKKLTRKAFYKSLKNKNKAIRNKRKNINKRKFRSSTDKIMKKEWIKNKILRKKKIHRLKIKKNKFISFKAKLLPYSRKPRNFRMGKGVGKVKNWFLNIYSGKSIFFLKNWHNKIAQKYLKYSLKYLPSKNILFFPNFKKFNIFFNFNNLKI